MINENRLGLASNPWPVVVPVLLIAVLTIGMNLVTDAISRKIVGVDRDAAFTDALMTDVQVEQ
jgi:peptide/nickel transport system permease protein